MGRRIQIHPKFKASYYATLSKMSASSAACATFTYCVLTKLDPDQSERRHGGPNGCVLYSVECKGCIHWRMVVTVHHNGPDVDLTLYGFTPTPDAPTTAADFISNGP